MNDNKFDELPTNLKWQYINESLRENWPISSFKARWMIEEMKLIQDALADCLGEVGPCNDEEKARGRCAGHPMITKLPCPFGEARKLLPAP